MTEGANGNVLFAGCTSSFGYGNFDMFLVRLVNDSNVQSAVTTVISYEDKSLPIAGTPGERDLSSSVRVFPNPLHSEATVLIQGENECPCFLNLYDVRGRCVIHYQELGKTNHGQSFTILKRGNLNPGIYAYEIVTEGGRIAAGKLCVE